jgi:hypothetical protein
VVPTTTGSVHERVADASPEIAVMALGAAARATAEVGALADPTDAEVMAETLTYVVAPPTTPEISARVTAEPVSAMRVLQTRPSFEVSMR